MGLFGGVKTIIGVDIGTASIKVVELAQDGGRFILKNYGIFELQAISKSVNPATNKERDASVAMTNEDIVWSIKEILKQTNIKCRDVVMSIPSYPTFATTIKMQYLSEDDIANSIPYEARKYIPVPLEEVQLDWSIIKTTDSVVTGVSSQGAESSKDKPSVEVLLIAVPKDEIARYKAIAKDADLKLKALELESFALSRAIIGNDLSPVCIVSVGGRSTSIFIVDNGYQRISHDYEVGGFEVTKAISKSLNISLERAEELKKNYGTKDSDDNMIREAMLSLLDMMVFEAKKTIQNYEDIKKTSITKVFLVGGLANMPDFVRYFSEKLGREVVLGNPTSRVVIPDGLESKQVEINSTFAVAMGLAMRSTK